MSRLLWLSCGLSLWISGAWLHTASGEELHPPFQSLRVRELPAPEIRSLHMRTSLATPKENTRSVAQAERVDQAETSQLLYKPLPTESRDLRERIVFKTNLGYGLDSSALSGTPGLSGVSPGSTQNTQGNAYSTRRHYVLGDAIVGSRGILLPSLSTYFLSRFRLVTSKNQFSASRSVYDAQGTPPVLVRAGYAELDGLGGNPGGLRDSIHLRAGRQYRYGASQFVSQFDGLTMRIDHPIAEVSGFVGQRVSLFLADNPGLVGGLGLVVHGKELLGYPVDLAMDYLRFDGGSDLPARHVVEAKVRVQPAKETRIYLRGRFIDKGGDATAGISRLSARVRQNIRDKFIVVLDLTRDYATQFAFDYAGAYSVDVVRLGQELGLGFAPPRPSTQVGGRISYQITKATEGHAFYRNKFVSQKESADTHSRPFQEMGIAASSHLSKPLSVTAQYKLRIRDLEATEMVEEIYVANTSSSGLAQMHELSAFSRYAFGRNKASASLGGYFRVSEFETPYTLVKKDSIGGGRLALSYAMTQLLRSRIEGELAQPSQALSPDLSTLFSLRLIMEAQF